MQIGPTQMLIFGGESTQSFTFNITEVHEKSKQATVTATQGELPTRAHFGYKSDIVARKFDNFLYAIDACDKNLYVYQIEKNAW